MNNTSIDGTIFQGYSTSYSHGSDKEDEKLLEPEKSSPQFADQKKKVFSAIWDGFSPQIQLETKKDLRRKFRGPNLAFWKSGCGPRTAC